MTLNTLYAAEPDEVIEEDEEPSAANVAMPSDGVVRPMNVHRLANNARLYFSEANVVIGPPSELIYLSRLKTPQTCFALELGSDSMMNAAGGRSFKPGSILIFSSRPRRWKAATSPTSKRARATSSPRCSWRRTRICGCAL